MKKLLSILATCVLCCVLLIVPAFAADTVGSGTFGADGDNLSWTLDSDGVLTISGTGAMPNSWYEFSSNTSINSVVIEEGVTSIAYYAFAHCSNLTSVTLPSTLTTIGDRAFQYCSAFTSITIPSGVTSIGASAFRGCSSLVKIDVANDNTSYASVDGVLFTKDMSVLMCYPGGISQSSYTIPTGVTEIAAYAFYNHRYLKSLIIPEGVTTIGDYALAYSWNIVTLNLPASLEVIGNKALQTNNVQIISVASGNKNFVAVDNVLFTKDMSVLLLYPSGSDRTSYAIPEGVKTVSSDTFWNCSQLEYLSIPSSVLFDGTPVGYCYSLVEITVDEDNPYYCAVDGVLFSKDMTSLYTYPCAKEGSSYTIPTGVTKIERNAFSYCSSLTTVIIPEGLTTVSNSAFGDCNSLIMLVFPESLTYLDDYAINYCSNLSSIYLPAGLTHLGSQSFWDCDLLADLYFGGTEDQWAALVEYSYFTLPAGATIHYEADPPEIPEIVETTWTLEDGVLTVSGSGIMSNYENGSPWHDQIDEITKIVIDDRFTSIGSYAFSDCYNATSVVIPEGITSIGDDAFSYCESLTSITLPESLKVIGRRAFTCSSSLTEINIPANVSSIGEAVFWFCDGLTAIHVDEDNQTYCSVDGVLFTKDMTSLLAYPANKAATSYTVPSTVTTMEANAFGDLQNLKTISIPAGLNSLGSRPFYWEESLTAINVSSDNTVYTSVNGILYNKAMTTLLHVPSNTTVTNYVIPASVTKINSAAICGNKTITTLTLGSGVSSIGTQGIDSCYALSAIKVSTSNTVYAGKDGVLFSKDLSALILYPRQKTTDHYTVPSSVITIGESAVENNPYLTTLTVSEGVVDIKGYAFYHCSNLTTISLPSSLRTIGQWSFSYCSQVETMTIPEGVTSIDRYAFIGCSSMASISLPASLQYVASGAFYYCMALSDIYFAGTEEQWLSAVGQTNNVVSSSANVHYGSTGSVTDLSTPTIAVSTKASSGKPVISWSAITNAASYEVWYATSKTGTYTKLTSTTASVLSVTHTGATLGEDYYYKVCAVNGSTKSEFSSIKGVYCDLAQPTIKVTTSASSGKPYISWTAVEGATGYDVYRSTSKTGSYTKLVTTTASKLSVTHTGAEVGQAYYYKVRAIYSTNTSCNSALTDAKGVYCDLPQPTIKVTTSASSGKPYISWTAVDGATAYEVYYCGTSNGTYSKLYTATSTKLSITHTGATAGEDYYYKVRAVYGSNTSCNSALTAYKGVWCDLKAPTIKVTNRLSDGKPYITWGAIDGATGYQVYYSNTSTGTYKLLTTTASTKLYVAHTGAKVGQTYFYKVVAVHSNSKCNSGYSAYKGVWCDLARSTLNVDLNDNGKPYITWTAVTGATSYKVYCSTNGGTYKLLFTDSTGRLYCTHSGATSGNEYSYKVIAIYGSNASCNSAYSVVKTITV